MNKKLILSLSIAVLAVTALFTGNQTIKSINRETTQTMSSTVNEADNITTVVSGSSVAAPAESKEEVLPVAANEQPQASPNNQHNEKKISSSEAEAIALAKAGFSASEVYDKEVELDHEKDKWVYEVSFEKDRNDYEYVIDAVSGEILYSKAEPEGKSNTKPKSESDTKDKKTAVEESTQSPSASKNEAPESRISASEAQAIALRKAGFSASAVYEKEVELDYEKSKWVYEVSFEKDRTDYEYIIDAVTGEILYSEVDIDD